MPLFLFPTQSHHNWFTVLGKARILLQVGSVLCLMQWKPQLFLFSTIYLLIEFAGLDQAITGDMATN